MVMNSCIAGPSHPPTATLARVGLSRMCRMCMRGAKRGLFVCVRVLRDILALPRPFSLFLKVGGSPNCPNCI